MGKVCCVGTSIDHKALPVVWTKPKCKKNHTLKLKKKIKKNAHLECKLC